MTPAYPSTHTTRFRKRILGLPRDADTEFRTRVPIRGQYKSLVTSSEMEGGVGPKEVAKPHCNWESKRQIRERATRSNYPIEDEESRAVLIMTHRVMTWNIL